MAKEATKVSFSFSSSSSSSRPAAPKRPPPSADEDVSRPQLVTVFDPSAAPKRPPPSADEDVSRPQLVTVFDPSAAPQPSHAKPVIPPIPNAEYNPSLKRMKNLLPLPDPGDDPSAAAAETTCFVLDTSTGDAPAGHIRYGLTLRAADPEREEEDGTGRGRSRAQNDELMQSRFREDLKNLPEDRGMEEFDDIKVEDFAAAMLAGYGWAQGQVIGRNKKLSDTNIFEYKRRGGSEGLGYNPSLGDPKKRKGGDWVKEKEKIVRIISGRYIGSKGKVMKSLENNELILKLETGDEVKLKNDMVVELGSVEEEKFTRKVRESEDEHKSSRKEENGSRETRKEEKKSNINSSRKESRSKETRRDMKKNDIVQGSSRSSTRNEAHKVRWLMSHIRVRIISKNFRSGKLYLKKGRVVDVVGPTTCDISMDGTEELVQGVDQEILETVLPKTGGSVIVLYGKHKGVFGNLVERNSEKEIAVVRDADSHDLIKVKLDEIAEYLGDPSYLGY